MNEKQLKTKERGAPGGTLGNQTLFPADPVEDRRRVQESLLAGCAENGRLNLAAVDSFRQVILKNFEHFGRDFPWRRTTDPYHIFVSEIMLQQTQTERVTTKFEEFVSHFPDFESLAASSVEEILAFWKGLGYNRRALALRDSAKRVVLEFGGQLPRDPEVLVTFPGLGKATAASVAAFAFDEPVVFIETNIRCVYIYFFFTGHESVTDRHLMPFIEQTLDSQAPRRWYSALMDYGVMMKSKIPGLVKRSAHYVRQPAFKGSDRQIRGAILRELLERQPRCEGDFSDGLGADGERLRRILETLVTEGFLARVVDGYTIWKEDVERAK